MKLSSLGCAALALALAAVPPALAGPPKLELRLRPGPPGRRRSLRPQPAEERMRLRRRKLQHAAPRRPEEETSPFHPEGGIWVGGAPDTQDLKSWVSWATSTTPENHRGERRFSRERWGNLGGPCSSWVACERKARARAETILRVDRIRYKLIREREPLSPVIPRASRASRRDLGGRS